MGTVASMLAPSRASVDVRQDFLALPISEQKKSDLRHVFGENGDVALKARCIRPDHKDLNPSLLISADHAYCLGCGSFWWPDQFLLELGDRPLQVTPGSVPSTYTGPRFIPMAMAKTYNRWLNTHYQARIEWLYARGLRLDDGINPNLLGYDGTAFVIPVIEGNTVQALRFRRDDSLVDELEDPDKQKYWGLPGKNRVQFYKPRIPDWVSQRSECVHLCEGELDALRLAQEGLEAWSLTNGCRSFRPEHVAQFAGRKVKVCYDQDTEGRNASQRICRLLGAKNVLWPEVLGKDVTQFLQRWSLQAFLNHL
jgi:hypothetical protein